MMNTLQAFKTLRCKPSPSGRVIKYIMLLTHAEWAAMRDALANSDDLDEARKMPVADPETLYIVGENAKCEVMTGIFIPPEDTEPA